MLIKDDNTSIIILTVSFPSSNVSNTKILFILSYKVIFSVSLTIYSYTSPDIGSMITSTYFGLGIFAICILRTTDRWFDMITFDKL